MGAMQRRDSFDSVLKLFDDIKFMRQLDPTAFVHDLKACMEDGELVDWEIDDSDDDEEMGPDASEYVTLTCEERLVFPLAGVVVLFETVGTNTMGIAAIAFIGESHVSYEMVTDDDDESVAAMVGNMVVDDVRLSSAKDIAGFLRTDPVAAFIHHVMLAHFGFDPCKL